MKYLASVESESILMEGSRRVGTGAAGDWGWSSDSEGGIMVLVGLFILQFGAEGPALKPLLEWSSLPQAVLEGLRLEDGGAASRRSRPSFRRGFHFRDRSSRVWGRGERMDDFFL